MTFFCPLFGVPNGDDLCGQGYDEVPRPGTTKAPVGDSSSRLARQGESRLRLSDKPDGIPFADSCTISPFTDNFPRPRTTRSLKRTRVEKGRMGGLHALVAAAAAGRGFFRNSAGRELKPRACNRVVGDSSPSLDHSSSPWPRGSVRRPHVCKFSFDSRDQNLS